MDLEKNTKRCRAINFNGLQCKLSPMMDGLCIKHFFMRSKLQKEDRLVH